MNTEKANPETKEETFEEVYADVEAALSDVDPDDREALNKRVSQIVDDIHSNRF